MSLKIHETRVKLHKSYRLRIKKDYEDLTKKRENSDYIKRFEKKVCKVAPSLLLKSEDLPIFNFSSLVVVDEPSSINEISILINQLKETRYYDLLQNLSKHDNANETLPFFDQEGNVSNKWIKNDIKYRELINTKAKIKKFTQKRNDVESNIQQKLFSFKDVLYKVQDPKTLENITDFKIDKLRIKKDKKYLTLLKVFNFSSLLFLLGSIIMLIVFATIGV